MATDAAIVSAVMFAVSTALNEILPPDSVVTSAASKYDSIILVIVLIELPPAPAADAATAPPDKATAPPSDVASMVEFSLALNAIPPAVALTLDDLIYAWTVFVILLLAVAAPTAPAAPPAPPPAAPAIPPAFAMTDATSVAVKLILPPAVTPLLPSVVVLLMYAWTVLVIVLLEFAPAPATAAPTTPPPTATAPPTAYDLIVALSFAVRLSARAEVTLAESMYALTVLVILFSENATPSAAPTPTVPPPTARLKPPASAVILDVSVAFNLIAPSAPVPIVVVTTAPSWIEAATVFPIVLPEPAPAAPTPTPAPPPPPTAVAPPIDIALMVELEIALNDRSLPVTLTMELSI